ncbi:hypothetical protein EDB19DRAFT_1190139 [Suillus lakei]|nr:hypothetical protein EDB19DRAFT_1190139 [Suillus lakei]
MAPFHQATRMHSALQMRFAAVIVQLLCDTLSAHTFNAVAHSHAIMSRTFLKKNCLIRFPDDARVPSDCITRPCDKKGGTLDRRSSLQKEYGSTSRNCKQPTHAAQPWASSVEVRYEKTNQMGVPVIRKCANYIVSSLIAQFQ